MYASLLDIITRPRAARFENIFLKHPCHTVSARGGRFTAKTQSGPEGVYLPYHGIPDTKYCEDESALNFSQTSTVPGTHYSIARFHVNRKSRQIRAVPRTWYIIWKVKLLFADDLGDHGQTDCGCLFDFHCEVKWPPV